MKNEYKIIYFKSISFKILAVMIILDIYAFSTSFKNIKALLACFIFFLFILIFGLISYFYSGKLKVYVDNESLTVKLPDRIAKVAFKNIYKIEKILGWGTWGYNISYQDEKGKKRVTGFSDDLENYREVIDYISKKSGIQVKMGL